MDTSIAIPPLGAQKGQVVAQRYLRDLRADLRERRVVSLDEKEYRQLVQYWNHQGQTARKEDCAVCRAEGHRLVTTPLRVEARTVKVCLGCLEYRGA